MKKSAIAFLALIALGACKNSENRKDSTVNKHEDPMFAQMDANKDGFLSKAEIKGPLKNDFAKVDLNKDGLISKEELRKAPKPNRTQGGGRPQGPPRNN
jgi:Ca2+-binding EF-hand superfamily protein